MTTTGTTTKTTARRQLNGEVVSVAGKNTVVVKVDRFKLHPVYKKQYRVTKKYMAHDAESVAAVGDTVVIEEVRPVSKRKRFRVIAKA